MTDDNLKRIRELEGELSYLVNDTMTVGQKIKSLSDAYWEAHNSGYGDAMANRLMGGEEDEQTRLWEKNCGHKYEINELLRQNFDTLQNSAAKAPRTYIRKTTK